MISGPGCHPPRPRYPAHTFKNKETGSQKEAQKEIEPDVKTSETRPETMQSHPTKRIGRWKQKQVRRRKSKVINDVK
jgi:hypothetical protein